MKILLLFQFSKLIRVTPTNNIEFDFIREEEKIMGILSIVKQIAL